MARWLVWPSGSSEIHEFASDSDVAMSASRKVLEGQEWVDLYDDELRKVLLRWEVTEHYDDGTVKVEATRFG